MSERFLAVENVSLSYGSGRGQTWALRDVSIDFEPASLTVIKGPSGSGKTSLLSVLGCLRVPDRGSVWIQGRNAARMGESQRAALRRNAIGFVFQAFRLFKSLSALDNVAIVGEIGGGSPDYNLARARLEILGLEGKLHLRPNQLSGGEKQRVAIARALMSEPAILLADEPTASLDAVSAQHICNLLEGLAQQEDRAVVVVSHDERWQSFADRTITLTDGTVNETEGVLR